MSLLSRVRNFHKREAVRRSYTALQKQYAHHASPKQFDWDWKKIKYHRIALLNFVMARVGGADARYLEIGCNDNSLFDSLYSIDKTGIDPTAGGTHRLTSDAFFAQNERLFDLIFIDGLHHYDQIHRDTVNAMRVLSPGGWILLHDLLPRNWREHHVPRLQDCWTGDGWKVAWELIHTTGVDFRIFHIDHGVGALRLTDPSPQLVDLSGELTEAQYPYFVRILEKLPVVDWHTGIAWIEDGAAKQSYAARSAISRSPNR